MTTFISQKNISRIGVTILVAVLLLFPLFAFGQTPDYEPLAPLPQPSNFQGSGLTNYLNTLFYLAIGVASVLAVLMIIIGGIQYMSTEAISGKGEAKEKLWNAVKGLLLIAFAWLLLNTINPDLLKGDLDGIKDATKGDVFTLGEHTFPDPVIDEIIDLLDETDVISDELKREAEAERDNVPTDATADQIARAENNAQFKEVKADIIDSGTAEIARHHTYKQRIINHINDGDISAAEDEMNTMLTLARNARQNIISKAENYTTSDPNHDVTELRNLLINEATTISGSIREQTRETYDEVRDYMKAIESGAGGKHYNRAG